MSSTERWRPARRRNDFRSEEVRCLHERHFSAPGVGSKTFKSRDSSRSTLLQGEGIMGHERVGRLPRTRRWSSIVDAMAEDAPERTAAIAAATLDGVRARLKRIQSDPGVQAAFQFLVALAQAPGTDRPSDIPDLGRNPSALRLTTALNQYVDAYAKSAEYGAIARQAAGDTIAAWSRRDSEQHHLFTGKPTAEETWGEAATGAKFSELSRVFFARFVDRYIKYFLDREASAALSSISEREAFANDLSRFLDHVAQHAFETTKITQSFAAGWYNKNARGRIPTRAQTRGFLAIAFGKIGEELRREARP